jgi:hypothetical protein
LRVKTRRELRRKERTMGTQLVPVDRPGSDSLHPAVYGVMVALTAWFVLSVWIWFGGGYTALDNVVITVFFLMAVGIPAMLWLIWRHYRAPYEAHDAKLPFRHWTAGEFHTLTGRQPALQAFIEILLPITAVAIGITIYGLVFFIVAHSVAVSA